MARKLKKNGPAYKRLQKYPWYKKGMILPGAIGNRRGSIFKSHCHDPREKNLIDAWLKKDPSRITALEELLRKSGTYGEKHLFYWRDIFAANLCATKNLDLSAEVANQEIEKSQASFLKYAPIGQWMEHDGFKGMVVDVCDAGDVKDNIEFTIQSFYGKTHRENIIPHCDSWMKFWVEKEDKSYPPETILINCARSARLTGIDGKDRKTFKESPVYRALQLAYIAGTQG